MSPALNESSALEHFKCGNVIEEHKEIMFDFYPGLPHLSVSIVYISQLCAHTSSCRCCADACLI